MISTEHWGPADWAVVLIILGIVLRLCEKLGLWVLGFVGTVGASIFSMGKGPARDQQEPRP
jgi:hypothetical protein